MIINFIKFFHILSVLALLGTTGFSLLLVVRRNNDSCVRKNILRPLNKSLLYLSLLAGFTGTLLVYPKHFTFHTPWIQAAYVLVSIFFGAVAILFFFNHRQNRMLWALTYASLIVLLVGVVHDAVTKTTFLIAFGN